jgi:hypothetical protein
MINALNHNPINTQNRFQAGAIKVFEEADGSTDMFVPGLEDKYEDLAADFLESWLVTDSQPLFQPPSTKPAESPSTPPQTPVSKAKSEPTTQPEPTFTQFSLGLDWNVADQRH